MEWKPTEVRWNETLTVQAQTAFGGWILVLQNPETSAWHADLRHPTQGVVSLQTFTNEKSAKQLAEALVGLACAAAAHVAASDGASPPQEPKGDMGFISYAHPAATE